MKRNLPTTISNDKPPSKSTSRGRKKETKSKVEKDKPITKVSASKLKD